MIQYRQHGRARRMIIGSAVTVTAVLALAQARKLLAKVELGEDPQADRKDRRERDELHLRSLVKQYLEYKATTAVSATTLRLAKHYLEGPDGFRAKDRGMRAHLHGLTNVPADQIGRKDIAARLLQVSKEHGVRSAIALRSNLSSMFSWAMTMGLVESNPIIGAFKPERPKSRERVLDNAEITAIWKAVDAYDYGKVIKLLILTACRRSEIAGMRWPEFDFDQGTWTLPTERSKNGKALTLPLTPLMLEIIESIPHRHGLDILFGTKYGFTNWSLGKAALDEKLDFETGFTHHDIRRSVATGMGKRLGIPPHVIDAVLNHTLPGVTGIYNRNPYEKEVRDAMLLWDDHISSLIKGSKRKVIAFDAKRA
jgi:integrase